MEPELILTGISTVGFPIAAFIMMFWFATKTVSENTKAIHDLKLALLKKDD